MCGLTGIETITMLPGHRGASLSLPRLSARLALIVTPNLIGSGVEFLSLAVDENKVDTLSADDGF
jgi:hypothetical protein